LLHCNVGYEKCSTLFSTITMVMLDRFWYFLHHWKQELPSRYKLFHFNITMSTLYLVKWRIAHKQPPLTAVRSVEPIVPKCRRNSFIGHFCPCLLENTFSSFLTENILHSRGIFIKNLSPNSIRLVLTCKLKLNCRDLRRITIMTSLSY